MTCLFGSLHGLFLRRRITRGAPPDKKWNRECNSHPDSGSPLAPLGNTKSLTFTLSQERC